MEINPVRVSISSSKSEPISKSIRNDASNDTWWLSLDGHVYSFRCYRFICLYGMLSSDLFLTEKFDKRKGFSSFFSVTCKNCEYSQDFETSKQCGLKNGRDINRRLVYTMRSSGAGYHAISKFASFMNTPSSITKNNYNKINKICREAAKEVAEMTMTDAATDIKAERNTDIGVSVDAAWARRGFSSLNGVTTCWF